MTDLIPPFENTPVEAIATTVKKLRAAFNSQVTKPLEFRLQQLRKLYWGCVAQDSATTESTIPNQVCTTDSKTMQMPSYKHASRI